MRKSNPGKNKRVFLFTLALFIMLAAVGISKLHPQGLETLEVDLKNRVFKSQLPFDVKFNLKVTGIDDNVERVELKYLIVNPDLKEKYNFPKCKIVSGNKICERDLPEWVRKGDEDFFVIKEVGPLHPNVQYAFKFTIYSKVKQKDVSDDLHKTLKTIFKNLKQDTINDFKKAIPVIEKEINQFIRARKLVILDSNQKYITLFDIAGQDKFKTLFNDLYNNAQNQKNADAAIKLKIRGLIKDLTSLDDDCKLHDKLYIMLKHPEGFDPLTRLKWESPLIKKEEKDDGESVQSMADIAAILADGLQSQINNQQNRTSIYNILDGKAKIEGDRVIFTPNGSLDIASLRLLHVFIQKINSQTFQYKNKTLCQLLENSKTLKCPNIAIKLSVILGYFERFFENYEKKVKLQKESKQLIEKFSNQFTTIRSIEVAEIIGTNDYSNYIALDFGVGHAFGIKSLFLYAGVNFYSVPINKKAPLKFLRFKGRHWFRKRCSFLFGLTTKGIEEGHNKNLISGTSLLVGIGFRWTKSIKTNVGGLLFKQIDENPLVDRQHTKMVLFASISFDIDIKPLIGKLSSLF